MSESEETLYDRLKAPFGEDELKFFPVALSNDKQKAKVGTYVDARAVMDRLDDVMGPENWQTSYEVLEIATKAVTCRLSLRFGNDWITKGDVGYPNEGKDADNANKEPLKAAYSDALKRAAVQFGIARFIYSIRLERDWLPVDKDGRFTEAPRLRGQSSSAAPPSRPSSVRTPAPTAGATPAAPADYAPDPRLGEWASPDGANWQGYEDFLHDQGISFEAKRRVAPGKTDKSWSPPSWLKANEDKTLNDLTAALIAEQKGIEAERRPVGAR